MIIHPDFKIEVEEKKTYWQRMANTMLYSFIMLMAVEIFLFYAEKIDISYCFISSGVLLLFMLYPADQLSALFISQISIANNYLCIKYSKRNRNYIIEGPLEEFYFNKDYGSKATSQTNYLEVKRITMPILRLYEKWGWEKGPLTETIDYLEQINAHIEGRFL
jgi:hypothetical protein